MSRVQQIEKQIQKSLQGAIQALDRAARGKTMLNVLMVVLVVFIGYRLFTGRSLLEGFSGANLSGYLSTPSALPTNHGAPVSHKVSSFDGIQLSSGGEVGWRSRPTNYALGTAFPLGNDEKMSFFANNQCKPECCPGSFSCYGGCVCTTKDQINHINARGGNRVVE